MTTTPRPFAPMTTEALTELAAALRTAHAQATARGQSTHLLVSQMIAVDTELAARQG